MNATCTVNGIPVSPGDTVPAGGELVITIPGWKSVWIDVNWNGSTGRSIWNANGVFAYGPLPPGEGAKFIQISNNDRQGHEGVFIRLIAKAMPKPEPSEPTKPSEPAPETIRTAPLKPAQWNGGGKRYELDSAKSWTALITPAAGSTVQNGTLFTPWSDQFALYIDANDVVVRDVVFAAGTGNPAKLVGKRILFENVQATTFGNYFAFLEGAEDVTLRRCKVHGGSIPVPVKVNGQSVLRNEESILRIDDAKNLTIEDCEFINTVNSRAALRGAGSVVSRRNLYRGAVVGVNPLTGGNGGELFGVTQFITAKGLIDVVHGKASDSEAAAAIKRCVETVLAARDSGVTDRRKLCHVGAKAAGFTITDAEADDTMRRREIELDKRSSFDSQDDTFDFGIRWEAGTTATIVGGRTIASNLYGNPLWNNPGTAYPAVCLLPGDRPRPRPAILFVRHDFEQVRIGKSEFLAQAKAAGAMLDRCTFNGVPL